MEEGTMTHAISADGTSIGYDVLGGSGPVVVLVSGGLDDGAENIPLGERLARSFTVVTYRRRGRGDSGDNPPYAVERECEDLAAVIAATDGRAHVFAASSGGALALRAAAAGLPVGRVVAHEIPYLVGEEMLAGWRGYLAGLAAALDRGEHDEALRLFMRLAGSSEHDIAQAEADPVWQALRRLAPTLRYDAACLGDGPPPVELLAGIAQPVLLTTAVSIDPRLGGLPVDFFGAAADAAAAALPDGHRATIPGGHVADPELLGPVVEEFFLS